MFYFFLQFWIKKWKAPQPFQLSSRLPLSSWMPPLELLFPDAPAPHKALRVKLFLFIYCIACIAAWLSRPSQYEKAYCCNILQCLTRIDLRTLLISFHSAQPSLSWKWGDQENARRVTITPSVCTARPMVRYARISPIVGHTPDKNILLKIIEHLVAARMSLPNPNPTKESTNTMPEGPQLTSRNSLQIWQSWVSSPFHLSISISFVDCKSWHVLQTVANVPLNLRSRSNSCSQRHQCKRCKRRKATESWWVRILPLDACNTPGETGPSTAQTATLIWWTHAATLSIDSSWYFEVAALLRQKAGSQWRNVTCIEAVETPQSCFGHL